MGLLHDIVKDMGRMKSVEPKNMDFSLCWDAVERLNTSFAGM
jgi:hypothetical protein